MLFSNWLKNQKLFQLQLDHQKLMVAAFTLEAAAKQTPLLAAII